MSFILCHLKKNILTSVPLFKVNPPVGGALVERCRGLGHDCGERAGPQPGPQVSTACGQRKEVEEHCYAPAAGCAVPL